MNAYKHKKENFNRTTLFTTTHLKKKKEEVMLKYQQQQQQQNVWLQLYESSLTSHQTNIKCCGQYS